jgi:DNA-binding MarR family transcriptional regulator
MRRLLDWIQEAYMKQEYLAVIALAERLHRRTLDRLQVELTQLKIQDLNAVQAMILLNIGPQEVTAKDLMIRGCYQGTNISYNLKRLTENGYIEQSRSENDRRLVLIRLTAKGQKLLEALDSFYEGLANDLAARAVDEATLDNCRATLSMLDIFTGRQTDQFA